jgi:hypothetical protein
VTERSGKEEQIDVSEADKNNPRQPTQQLWQSMIDKNGLLSVNSTGRTAPLSWAIHSTVAAELERQESAS